MIKDIFDFAKEAYKGLFDVNCTGVIPCLTIENEYIGTWKAYSSISDNMLNEAVFITEKSEPRKNILRDFFRYCYNSFLYMRFNGKLLLVGKTKTVFTDDTGIVTLGLDGFGEPLVFSSEGLITDCVNLGIKEVISHIPPHYMYSDDMMFIHSGKGFVGYADKKGFIHMNKDKLTHDRFFGFIPSQSCERFLKVYQYDKCDYISDGLIIKYTNSELHFWIKNVGYMHCANSGIVAPSYENEHMYIRNNAKCPFISGMKREEVLRRLI